MKSTRPLDLFAVNAYWPGIAFLWNSLHLIVLPALLLTMVDPARKNTALGLLTFAGLVLATVIQPLAGAASDGWMSRFGRRRPWMIFGTALDIVFLMVLAAARDLPTLALGYLGLQLSSNLAHGPAQGLMHDRVPPGQMGRASGIKNLLDMSGLVMSSLLVGRLISPTDPDPSRAMAWIAAVLVAGLLIIMFTVREDSSPASRLGLGARLRSAIQVDLRATPAFWRLIAGRFVFLLSVYPIQAFAQYYVRDRLNAPNPVELTGNLMAAIVLSLIAFSVLGGYLVDRLGRRRMHFVAAALVAVGGLLMLPVRTPGLVLVFGSIVGAGIGVFLTANWALANDLSPRGEAGKYLGLTNIATAGAGATSRLAGPVIDGLNLAAPGQFLGYSALFLGAAVLAAASLLALRGLPDSPAAPATASPDPS
ncbi:MAG TPA: MFS transporter [Anaerolineales bacterium]|nr:MFS transporter [Anaerolineales bacterium]